MSRAVLCMSAVGVHKSTRSHCMDNRKGGAQDTSSAAPVPPPTSVIRRSRGSTPAAITGGPPIQVASSLASLFHGASAVAPKFSFF